MMQKVEVFGEVPLARFGHTITQGRSHRSSLTHSIIVSKSKVVLFGGATGDTGKYIITGDTYTLDLISFKWTKLEGKKNILETVNRFGNRTLTQSSSWKHFSRPTSNGSLWRCHRR